MHRTLALFSRAPLGLRHAQIDLILPTRSWAHKRQGFSYGFRQFHATPQTRFLSLTTAVPVWLAVHLIGALPQVLRTGFDILDARDNQRKLETVGPLLDISQTIANRRRKKLSVTAVSTKVDADRLAHLNQLEQKFKTRMLEKVTEDRVSFNNKVFLPSALHCAWSWPTLIYLDSKIATAAFAQAPGMPEAAALLGNSYVHTAVGVVLVSTFFIYMQRNPFWSHISRITLPQVAPLWRFLYRLNPRTIVEARTQAGFLIPPWLHYVRVDPSMLRDPFAEKTMNEWMSPTRGPERMQATIYMLWNSGCVIGVSFMVLSATPLALLYSLGMAFGFAIRSSVNFSQHFEFNKEHHQQRAKWMPLALNYDR